jgi:hypothetical protein
MWQSINLYTHVIHLPFFTHKMDQKELLVAPLTQLVLTDHETPTHHTF